jgi:hypothetical protein
MYWQVCLIVQKCSSAFFLVQKEGKATSYNFGGAIQNFTFFVLIARISSMALCPISL